MSATHACVRGSWQTQLRQLLMLHAEPSCEGVQGASEARAAPGSPSQQPLSASRLAGRAAPARGPVEHWSCKSSRQAAGRLCNHCHNSCSIYQHSCHCCSPAACLCKQQQQSTADLAWHGSGASKPWIYPSMHHMYFMHRATMHRSQHHQGEASWSDLTWVAPFPYRWAALQAHSRRACHF